MAEQQPPTDSTAPLSPYPFLSPILSYSFSEAIEQYAIFSREPDSMRALIYRELGKIDLFFLLTQILRRPDAINEWCYDRCREVQADPDGYLDIWFREGYKSTILSFSLTIFDIINNPELTIAIFSQTRPAAKKVLRQIKQEFEENKLLQALHPEILWENPQAQAPKWSEDEGIVVKRKGNPKEATLEAWGLVDGQPAGPHWDLIVYDDVVTKTSVTTPEMIEKTNEMWELSLPLSKVGGKRRYAGTYYHSRDTYKLIEERGAAILRKYPATRNGKEDGEPVFMSKEELAKRRREWGQVTYATQMLLDPTADNLLGFKKEWLKFWDASNITGLNMIILCDPAGTKKKSSGHDPDYTVFILLGYGSDENWYVCDMVRDRLNLTERADVLFDWHRHYRPMFVGYEKYGMQSDIEHYKDRMNRENYRFELEELGGIVKKSERIGSLIPDFEQGRLYLPKTLMYQNSEGKDRDLVQDFINEEYLAFPVAQHDDCLKAGTLIKTSLGYKYIEDLKVGDLVYTHMHRYQPIEKVIKKSFNGIFYNLRGPGQLSLEVSEDHRIYFTATSYKGCDLPGFKEDKCSRYGWIETKYWKSSYRNVIPIEKLEFKCGVYNTTKKQMARLRVAQINLDSDFSFILGYFLAEGHAHQSAKWNHKHMIVFASHANEIGKRDRITGYLNKLKIPYKECVKGNCATIKLSSKILWELFCECYDDDGEKIIPEFAYKNKMDLFAMMDGWISGDGWKLSTRTGTDQFCGSTSCKLALGMRDVALSRGWYVTLQHMTRHRYGVKSKDFYQVAINFNERTVFIKGPGQRRLRKTNNEEYTSYLKKSKPMKYVGDVYDLQVVEDCSFVANGFIIHNCLDCLARKNDPKVPKISRGATTSFTPNRTHLSTTGNWRFLPKSWRPRRNSYTDI